jgi:sugar phosphate permease
VEQVGVTERVLSLRDLLKTVGENPLFWPVVLAGVAMSALQFTLTAHAIGYLSNGLGFSLKNAASLFSFAQLLGIPGRILLPWLSDHYFPGRRTRSFGWTMIIAGLTVGSFVVLASGTPQVLLVVLLILLGVFGIGWFPLYLLQVAEMAPKSSIASTVSFATTLCMIVMALGPFIFGLLVDYYGYATAWACLVAPVLATAVPLLRNK